MLDRFAMLRWRVVGATNGRLHNSHQTETQPNVQIEDLWNRTHHTMRLRKSLANNTSRLCDHFQLEQDGAIYGLPKHSLTPDRSEKAAKIKAE